MKLKRLFISAAVAMALFASRPVFGGDVPSAWTGASERLLTSLVDRVPPAEILSTFTDRASIRSFDNGDSSIDILQSLCAGANWARVLTYRDMPDTVATDISAAIADAPVSDALRRHFTPDGDAQLRSANIVAMKWISHQLKTRQDQPISIVLLHKSATSGHGSLVVVLLGGERVGIDQYRVKQVAFGEFFPRR